METIDAYPQQFLDDPGPESADYGDYGDDPGQSDPANSPLIRWANMPNVADELPRETLVKIGARICEEYADDKASRAEWEKVTEPAMKAARQVREEKSFPWPKASNIKYPILAVAAMQFAARVYPEIMQGGNVVGAAIVGKDQTGEKKARSERVAEYMNYQVLDEMDGWEDDTDALLHVLPITGVCWRKTYWDGIGNRPASEFYTPDTVVWHYKSRRGRIPTRLTHVLDYCQNEIIERQRGGIWLKVELGQPDGDKYQPDDTQATHVFLECHCWWDLDDDGYAEPWIITVHQATREVVRIAPRYDLSGVHLNADGEVVRIEAAEYWTKYGFIPPPDGSDYDIGFGTLLHPITESINTLINQLTDAGTLANTGGGFLAKGARMQGGPVTFRPGEWKPIEVQGAVLRDSIVPMPANAPSPVLFQLLEFLLGGAKELTTVSAEITGQKSSPNEPATSVMARIEQGMKVFGAIQRRIYRSLSHEFGLLFKLDSRYLSDDDYARVLDIPGASVAVDFDLSQIDIKPTADPNIASEMQRLARSQAVMQVVGGAQGNTHEAARDTLKSMQLDQTAIDRYLPEGPTPREQQMMAQLQQANQAIQLLHGDLEKAAEKIAAIQGDQSAKAAEINLKSREIDIKEAEAAHKMWLAQQPPPAPPAAPAGPSEFDLQRFALDREKIELEREKIEREFDFRVMEHAHKLDDAEREESAASVADMAESQEKAVERDQAMVEAKVAVAESVQEMAHALTDVVRGITQKLDGERVIGVKQIRDPKTNRLVGAVRLRADGTEEEISFL